MGVGRRFSLKPVVLRVRTEFVNIFSRSTYLRHPHRPQQQPAVDADFQLERRAQQRLGYINPTATPNQLPRNGQIVARFQF